MIYGYGFVKLFSASNFGSDRIRDFIFLKLSRPLWKFISIFSISAVILAKGHYPFRFLRVSWTTRNRE